MGELSRNCGFVLLFIGFCSDWYNLSFLIVPFNFIITSNFNRVRFKYFDDSNLLI